MIDRATKRRYYGHATFLGSEVGVGKTRFFGTAGENLAHIDAAMVGS